MKLLIINGPNLNMLGIREPEIYGKRTFQDLITLLDEKAKELQVDIEQYQSNHEGCIVDKIQQAYGKIDGIVINPAAYTHTSIALRDALEAARIPAVEVHLSNVASRDEFRKGSLTAPMCIGQITGLGADGYEWAMRALVRYLEQKKTI